MPGLSLREVLAAGPGFSSYSQSSLCPDRRESLKGMPPESPFQASAKVQDSRDEVWSTERVPASVLTTGGVSAIVKMHCGLL